MRSLEPTAVTTGRIMHRIEETCGALMIKVMFDKTDATIHDLMFNRNLLATISIKNSRSQEKIIAANIPLLSMMQLTQNRKGFFNFLWDGQTAIFDMMGQYLSGGKIGVCGMIALSEQGNILLNPGDYIECTINKIPTAGAMVSISSVDLRGNSTTYVKYSSYNVVGSKRFERFRVQPHHKTILIPASDTVDRDFGDPLGNDYPNPLENINIFFNNPAISDMRLSPEDLRTHASLMAGNDLVGFWAKDEWDKQARTKSNPVIPPWLRTPASDASGQFLYMYCGAFDYACEDLEDISRIDIYKDKDGDLPFYIEKIKQL